MAGKWTGGIVTSALGTEPPTVEEWLPVAVPGDPGRFAGVEGPIAYRTTFADPRDRAAERTRIRIHGAYGRAHVWMNGRHLGTHEPYFAPAHLEFEPRSQNELIVCCEPPRAGGGGGLYETDEIPAERAVPGIWWDVRLQVRPTTFVRSLSVRSRLADGDRGLIETAVEIDAGEAIDDAVTLSLRPEGFRGGGAMERVAVDADAGERVTVSRSIEVRDPELWWPRGYGPHHRYTVRAKLGEDSTERTIGFRSIERDEDGLLVNGRRVRARGVGRLPTRIGREYELEDVRRAIDANASLLRVRGHVPSPAFYAACDEAGLLVWQDVPIRPADADAEAATSLVDSIEEAYGFHPSLAIYGLETTDDDPFADPLGTGLRSKLAFRWRALRASSDRAVADAVAARVSNADGGAAVLTAGPPGSGADAVDLSAGWRYLEASDARWVLERSSASIVGRFGAGSKTRETATSVPGLDEAVLERRASGAADSQRYQERTVQTVAEALRRDGCAIVVADAIRDGAPGGGTGVLAEDGSVKPAYGALARAYEPVQVVLDGPPTAGSSELAVINDAVDRVETTVTWRAGENGGEVDVAADPLEIAPIGSIDVPADATEVLLEFPVGDRTVRNEYRL